MEQVIKHVIAQDVIDHPGRPRVDMGRNISTPKLTKCTKNKPKCKQNQVTPLTAQVQFRCSFGAVSMKLHRHCTTSECLGAVSVQLQ